jgi:hypothetical protein
VRHGVGIGWNHGPFGIRILALISDRLLGDRIDLWAGSAYQRDGGVGEGSATIRHRAAERLAYLGVAVDGDRNDRGRDDRDITADTATCGPLVITAREDLQVAGEARRLLSTP